MTSKITVKISQITKMILVCSWLVLFACSDTKVPQGDDFTKKPNACSTSEPDPCDNSEFTDGSEETTPLVQKNPDCSEPGQRRVALVIGNGKYTGNKALDNPINDAKDMATALKKAKFEVTQLTDASSKKMKTAIDKFGEQLKQCRNTVGLFYFAGHGMQYRDKNYLFPIGTMRLVYSVTTLQEKTVGVDEVLAILKKANNDLNIIILDACRNNPFRKTLVKSKTRGVYDQDGLAFMSAPDNFLIAYSTRPNTIAWDGDGNNSPYVKHLKKELIQPQVRIEEMLRRVRKAVLEETQQQQAPMYSAALNEPFCFVGTCPHIEIPPSSKQTCELPPPNPLRTTFSDPLKDGSNGPEMVEIPAGTFKMGDTQGSSHEKPVHSVSVNKFAIGRYEVTFDDYDRFVKAIGRKQLDELNDPNDCFAEETGKNHGKCPVIKVSWEDATAYTEWLTQQTGKTYRLPTEAQWEYAARAGTRTQYWWGDTICPDWIVCDGCNREHQKSPEQPAQVGSYSANQFGLHDTAGNVWEWTCSEYQDNYNGKEKHCVDKNNARDEFHIVARGGSWYSIPEQLRSAYRFKHRPTERYNEIGFRVVREITK